MTIKVEQEVLLRVLEPRSSHHSPLDVSIQVEDDFLLVDFRKPISHDCSVEKIREDAYDDDDSIFTLSTASLSDSSDCCSEIERRVSFADDLVTDEWTRPYTPKDLIPTLYYSTEETTRFRQEYRLERKLLNDLSVNPDSFPVDAEDLSSVLLPSQLSLTSSWDATTARHRISRVVVLHNDKLETFFDNDDSPIQVQDIQDEATTTCPTFFDNDSFWSGSITWY